MTAFDGPIGTPGLAAVRAQLRRMWTRAWSASRTDDRPAPSHPRLGGRMFRAGSRVHTNDAPTRHLPTGKIAGGRGTPSRGATTPANPVAPTGTAAPTNPVAPTGTAAPTNPVAPTGTVAPTNPVAPAGRQRRPPLVPAAREETVELRTLPTTGQPAGRPTDRPDPDDAAAEVWALVERAQAGEGEAFGLIYDRYFDTVFRFIYFRVGNRPLAEDLTSETFLRALRRIATVTWQGRDLGAWLVTIARNLVVDYFKSGRYRLEVITGDVLDAEQVDRGPEGSPEVAVVEHITNVALLTAVKQLNPEQQECIVLRFLHGFSVAETAQVMGKNEGAIKALQYRAVRALHRLLPEGFQP